MPKDPTDVTNLDEALGRERIEPALPDPRRERWIRWLQQIDSDLSNLAINRMSWRTLTAVWRDRDPQLPPSVLFDFWAHTYAHTQASGIRRQADRRKGVASLRRLSDIAARPDLITRRFCVGRYPWGQQHLGEREFAELDQGSGHLDPAIPTADLQELVRTADDVVEWTHKAVAHLSEIPAQSVPTFDDLDKGLDALGRIFQRWNCILTGHDRVDLEPVPQYDWLAPLREPWILNTSSADPPSE